VLAGRGRRALRQEARPLHVLRRRRAQPAPLPERLRFGGGLVGYFGYEAVRHIEPRALGAEKPDPLGTPDVLLLVSDELAVVDNVLGKLYIVVYADARQADALVKARERLERLRHRLVDPLPEALVLAQPAAEPAAAPIERVADVTESSSAENLERAFDFKSGAGGGYVEHDAASAPGAVDAHQIDRVSVFETDAIRLSISIRHQTASAVAGLGRAIRSSSAVRSAEAIAAMDASAPVPERQLLQCCIPRGNA
jgi:hypothetical protein